MRNLSISISNDQKGNDQKTIISNIIMWLPSQGVRPNVIKLTTHKMVATYSTTVQQTGY